MLGIFDKNLAQQIVSGVVVLLIGALLFGKRSVTASDGKGWKIAVILAYVMVLGGLFLMLANLANGGLKNLWAERGLLTAILGFLLYHVSKFFVWWNR